MKLMNKICGILIFSVTLLVNVQTAEAKTYKLIAESLTELSSDKATPKYVTLQVPAQKVAGANLYLENEAMLRIKVTNLQEARRGKRDGYLEGVLVAYSVPNDGNKAIDISDRALSVKVKKYSPTDFKGLAESAATAVAGQALSIPFLSQGVAAVKGAVKPIEGESRLKSAGISAYESTPFSYISKGDNLNVALGTKVTLSIKVPTEGTDDEVEENPNNVVHTEQYVQVQEQPLVE